ncbi:hypothetical protein REJC140_00425 [Pseudorhizobium endolithicum]|uniref:Transposase n=1 Tax=Pseudorhizobium endolithicum TaxID=1191678 RepID=A0ABN7JEW3_9HYPH|nr:hypothetical protein REJC140_00425 [Pseudorhizobium endolithicum]
MLSIRVASKGVYADRRAIIQRVPDGKPALQCLAFFKSLPCVRTDRTPVGC